MKHIIFTKRRCFDLMQQLAFNTNQFIAHIVDSNKSRIQIDFSVSILAFFFCFQFDQWVKHRRDDAIALSHPIQFNELHQINNIPQYSIVLLVSLALNIFIFIRISIQLSVLMIIISHVWICKCFSHHRFTTLISRRMHFVCINST